MIDLKEVESLVESLFNIPRSVSGDGNLKTLKIINQYLYDNLKIQFFENLNYGDWSRPSYWNLNKATIKTKCGETLISTEQNILHLYLHSAPFEGQMLGRELKKHLSVGTKQLNEIPYRTTYYKKDWGFCLSDAQFNLIHDNELYSIKIDTVLENRPTPYGIIKIPGKTNKFILITTYICHPNLANNELSGIVTNTILSKKLLSDYNGEYGIVLAFWPETFGAIAYIHENLDILKNDCIGSVVVSCVGDGRRYSLLEGLNSKRFYDACELVVKSCAKSEKIPFKHYDFLSRGSDERQLCAPNVSIPCVTFSNSKFGTYPEYHNSNDNLEIISTRNLIKSAEVLKRIIDNLNRTKLPRLSTLGEPKLSKYGLYPHARGLDTQKEVMKILNFCAYSDGKHTTTDIANLLGLNDIEVGLLQDKLNKFNLINYENNMDLWS